MKENNLLASVALFSELYNNEKYNNISDIIAEFIKGAVITEDKWTVSSTELVNLLEKVYDFRLPESVIRTTVNNRLKDLTTRKDGYYHFNKKIEGNVGYLTNGYRLITDIQNKIIQELIGFIETQEGKALSLSEQDGVFQCFNQYLLDNIFTVKYSTYISAFVIKNQDNEKFRNNLNLIREGLILYQGIRFTGDLNELGKWKANLTIFLSTEYLFSIVGYNGLLFMEILDDLLKLVSEINRSNKVPTIQLKYLEETQEEIDHFFQTAELIKKGQIALDPKPAMMEILKNCNTVSDVRNKKIKLEQDLKHKGITLEIFNADFSKYSKYSVEDTLTITDLKEIAEQKTGIFDEDSCLRFLKIFTKINYYRKGENFKGFEKTSHVFLTGNKLTLALAQYTKDQFGEGGVPFAKDIDYVINKFWFKLKKGFNESQSVPKSFDVITKAQLILSAQLNTSISEAYLKLQDQYKAGLLSKEEALERSYELREKPNKPEDITAENIDSSLDFLNNEDYFEYLVRENEKREAVFRAMKTEKEKLLKEIQRRDDLERLNKENENKQRLEFEKSKYINKRWDDEQYKLRNNLKYFLKVSTLTFLPIFTAIFLKVNQPINLWIESLGNHQWWIWGVLIFSFLTEILGRSYLFEKDKVKNGWDWFCAVFSKRQYNKIREEKILKFEKDFASQLKKNPELESRTTKYIN